VKSNTVAVIGLGFVGLTLATKLAETQRVYGVDTNPDVIKSVSEGLPHFHEDNLSPKLFQAVQSGSLSAHIDWSEVPPVDVYVVTVGTPILNGVVNLAALDKVIGQISTRSRKSDLVIIRSTVKVGSTREAFLNAYPGLKGLPLVAMCPERTIEGSAMTELVTLPQIVSGLNQQSLDKATEFFEAFGCSVVPVSSLEAAEFAKLLNNTYRDVQFAFANEMAVVAEQIGLDVREIINAANHNYPRSNVAMPGLTGGPCLEKDPWILAESAIKVNVDARITKSARVLHESLPSLAVARIKRELSSNKGFVNNSTRAISVLGLAFKGHPATDDVRGSLAKNLIQSLRLEFPTQRILGVDLEVSDEDGLVVGVDQMVSTTEAFNSSSILIVQNNHRLLADEIRLNCAAVREHPLIIFDFWGTLNPNDVDNRIELIVFGNGLEYGD
jgi:UDP-N-acetyl-D-mannosaminuronic acid dehydrogenase